MKNSGLLFLVSLITVSCSNISFEIPSGRLQSPEAQGNLFSGNADGRVLGSTNNTFAITDPGSGGDTVSYDHTTTPAFFWRNGFREKI